MSYSLQITISDTLYARLTQQAHQTGQPLEVLATTWLTAAAQHFAADPLAADPLDTFLGAFDSGGSDWADNHALYLGQMGYEMHASDQGVRSTDD